MKSGRMRRIMHTALQVGLLGLLLAGGLAPAVQHGWAARGVELAQGDALAPGEPLTQTLAAVADATLASAQPAVNNGGGAALSIGYFSGDGASIYRALARFDLSGIPADAVVISADLILYADAGTVSKQIQARRLTGGWDETTVAWNNQPGSAAPQTVRTVGASAGTYAWDASQAVQGWVSGEQANNGFLLRAADEAENGYRSLRSREAALGIPRTPNVRLVLTWMSPLGRRDPGPQPPASRVFLPFVPQPHDGQPTPIQLSPCPQTPVWTLLPAWTRPTTSKAPTITAPPAFAPSRRRRKARAARRASTWCGSGTASTPAAGPCATT